MNGVSLIMIRFLIVAYVFTFQSFDCQSKTNLETELNNLKKQTVNIHNSIIQNNKELKSIKVDIDRNKQKQIIF